METRLSPPAPSRTGGRGGVLLLALLLALVVWGVCAPDARADALDDRVRSIAKVLRCPVCAGESVADSQADISIQMRGIIRQKLEAGETPDQITAYFVARYGETILLSPQTSGFTLGVWVMPLVALLGGFAIVLTVLRSWSRRGARSPETEDFAPVAATPLAAPDEQRLEEELARFRREGARGDGVGG